MSEFEPGIYDISEDAYHADPVPGGSLSSTGARKLLPPCCPAKFRYEQDHPVHKDVFDFGSAAHRVVLGTGPDLAVIDAEDWKTRAAKDARDKARAEGKTPVLRDDHDKVQAMAAAVHDHPIAGAVFDPERGGKPEQSLFWQADGIWKRARLDWLPDWTNAWGRLIVADYKTTTSADPASIAKSVANFGYHQQAAFYLEGVRELADADDPAFVFVFQEKTAPYLVTVISLDHDALRAGRERNALAAEIYRDCQQAGIWPGYSTQVEQISLPPWARSHEGEYL